MQRQVVPVVDCEVHVVRRAPQEGLDRHQLCRGAAGADLGGDVAHLDAALGRDLKLRDRGFRARAEVLLHGTEAYAVAQAGVGGLEVGLALGALGPHRVLGGHVEDLADAQMTRGRGALGVLHAALEHIAPAQLDGVQADLLGDLIDQHLGIGHGLHRAVAAHGAGRDADGGVHLGRQVALGEVVNGLRRRHCHRAHRGAEVGHAAAVAHHVAGQRVELAVLVHRDRCLHVEGMALECELEVLPAVQRQPHRAALGVQRRQCHVEREGMVLLLAVAHGVGADVVELVQRQLAVLEHVHHMLGRAVGRLARGDHVQRTAALLIPGQAVFHFHGHMLDGLAVVLACKRAQTVPGLFHLGLDAGRLAHQRAEGRVAAVRPVHAFFIELRPDDGVLHGREPVLAIAVLALHAYIARGHIGRARRLGSLGSEAEDRVVEAQALVGHAELLVVVPDGHGHGVTQHGRDLALLDEEFAVEARLGHSHAVGGDGLGVDQHIRLVVAAQHRQIQAFVDAVGARDMDGQRVRLLRRPALHVPGAQVDGKDLLPGDLGHAVAAVVERVAIDPVGLLTAGGRYQFRKCVFDRAHTRNHAHGGGSLQKTAPIQVQFGHGSNSLLQCAQQQQGLAWAHR